MRIGLSAAGLITAAVLVLSGWNWLKVPDQNFQRDHRSDYDGYRFAQACHTQRRYAPTALGYVRFLLHGHLRDALTVERQLDDQWSKQLVSC